MKKSGSYNEYLEKNREDISSEHMKIDRALSVMLKEKKLKKSDIIAKSGIENHYAYQIFSGVKIPSRDKVIMLCAAFALSPEEAIRLMKITGYAPLYGKCERDNAILFGLTKKLSLLEINELLYELGCELLI